MYYAYAESQNLQHHLISRESGWKHPGRIHPVPSTLLFDERNFYRSIVPNLSIQNVDKPLGYLRKFTPNGQLLLTFSNDQKSLDVYEYQGIAKVAHLLQQQTEECITAADHSLDSLHIRQQIFNSLLKHKYSVQLITSSLPARHFLNREFSLFLNDGRHVLMASMASGSIFPSYEAYREYPDLFDDTELYDYTFYLIDLEHGCVTDTLKFQHDFIVLSHNHSVSVYGNTLAILSTYRQCIDLVELDAECKLKSLYTVGPYGSKLDRERILKLYEQNKGQLDPGHSLPMSHLKQKILAYMYRNMLELEDKPDEQKLILNQFYKNFRQVERMIILKMQLLDSDHLLLRYEIRPSQMPLEMLVGNVNPIHNRNFKLYVFYQISQQKILRIYSKNSVILLQMLRHFCDEFRNVHSLFIPWRAASHVPSFFNEDFSWFAGGLTEAANRFNTNLPISSQSFSTSPYLDYSLFNYDDRSISSLERPRLNSIDPIKFTDRSSGIIKFRVCLGQPSSSDFRNDHADMVSSLMTNPRDLVTFIFHPYEPFFMSIQKFLSRYVINFHIYNENTRVKQV